MIYRRRATHHLIGQNSSGAITVNKKNFFPENPVTSVAELVERLRTESVRGWPVQLRSWPGKNPTHGEDPDSEPAVPATLSVETKSVPENPLAEPAGEKDVAQDVVHGLRSSHTGPAHIELGTGEGGSSSSTTDPREAEAGPSSENIDSIIFGDEVSREDAAGGREPAGHGSTPPNLEYEFSSLFRAIGGRKISFAHQSPRRD